MTARATALLPQDASRWRSRPRLAVALRLAILLAPVAAAAGVGLTVGHLIGDRPLWLFVLLVGPACVLTSVLVERVARRFLPLETLLRMTMLFPERAPSRLAVARLGRDRAELRRLLAAPAGADEVAHVMLALITALGRHDRRTRGHSERVRMITELLGEQLQLPSADRDRLRWAALLHDVGKLEIAATILSKPSALDATEWQQMQQHPTHGARLAGPFLDWLGEWAGGIVHHHEHWDGRGYPGGLAGEQISRAGRIVAVVDAFETMTAARSYKRAGSTRAALAELTRCAGTQFDPAVVRQFLCIPVPRLWWATGALGLLVQVPVIGSAQQSVLQVGTAVSASAGGTVAAAGTAAVVGVGSALGVTGAAPPSPRADVAVVTTSLDGASTGLEGSPDGSGLPGADSSSVAPGVPAAGGGPGVGGPGVSRPRSGDQAGGPTGSSTTGSPAGGTAPVVGRTTAGPTAAPTSGPTSAPTTTAPAPPPAPTNAPPPAPTNAPPPAPTTSAAPEAPRSPAPSKVPPSRPGRATPTVPPPSNTRTPPAATTPPPRAPGAAAPGAAPGAVVPAGGAADD